MCHKSKRVSGLTKKAEPRRIQSVRKTKAGNSRRWLRRLVRPQDEIPNHLRALGFLPTRDFEAKKLAQAIDRYRANMRHAIFKTVLTPEEVWWRVGVILGIDEKQIITKRYLEFQREQSQHPASQPDTKQVKPCETCRDVQGLQINLPSAALREGKSLTLVLRPL
jgi:hypothetical protein